MVRRLRHGDQLPDIRTLAEELVVSPHTVVKAYSELEHEGLLELRQGSGAFIFAKTKHTFLDKSVFMRRAAKTGTSCNWRHSE
jgi:DNA-binding transcriptional regulator YhcF (GntR family)